MPSAGFYKGVAYWQPGFGEPFTLFVNKRVVVRNIPEIFVRSEIRALVELFAIPDWITGSGYA